MHQMSGCRGLSLPVGAAGVGDAHGLLLCSVLCSTEQNGIGTTGGDGAELPHPLSSQCLAVSLLPELPHGAAPESSNGIRGLLAWSSHPNPAGRGKVRLGQKALTAHAWLWLTDPCAGSRDGAPEPSVLLHGWSQPALRHEVLNCGAGHRAWERALAWLRWAAGDG